MLGKKKRTEVRFLQVSGVADGTRTHDNQNHNLGLYQLSYSHHWKGVIVARFAGLLLLSRAFFCGLGCFQCRLLDFKLVATLQGFQVGVGLGLAQIAGQFHPRA